MQCLDCNNKCTSCLLMKWPGYTVFMSHNNLMKEGFIVSIFTDAHIGS